MASNSFPFVDDNLHVNKNYYSNLNFLCVFIISMSTLLKNHRSNGMQPNDYGVKKSLLTIGITLVRNSIKTPQSMKLRKKTLENNRKIVLIKHSLLPPL
jgi:hypothetical protein